MFRTLGSGVDKTGRGLVLRSAGKMPPLEPLLSGSITWYDRRVRTTIYLPDDLAQAVEAYLKEHPQTTLSALVREALEARLRRNPAALLELAGLVERASGSAGEGAEDLCRER